MTSTADDVRQSIVWARNGGYRDGFSGERASVPAWDTVPEWSNAYAEGYQLGAAARRKIKPNFNTQKELEL